jgi:phosphoglucosamine mutase
VTLRFGTDGVRGPAGTWPIDAAGATLIGRAIAAWSARGRILVGRDTRESSTPLAEALIEGLVSGGASVGDLGVVPTAAVSCAVVADSASGGVVITASHNPWTDNGFKVVDDRGQKLRDTASLSGWFSDPPLAPGGRRQPVDDPLRPWRDALPAVRLDGRRILLDGAHGAGAVCAAQVLSDRGATLERRGCAPNGRNINDGVGAMCPPTDLVGCDLGIALDGDADRLALTDPTHGVLDGDDLLWMLTRHATGVVVGTVMSNGGLETALEGRLLRAPVGDAHVAAAMATHRASIGGEPSGHIMFRDGMPTSDGLYTALRVLAAAGAGPLPVAGWNRLPQAHRSVRGVACPTHLPAISAAEDAGLRVLVRPSGTEPVVRVMVEGDDAEAWADRIAKTLPARR